MFTLLIIFSDFLSISHCSIPSLLKLRDEIPIGSKDWTFSTVAGQKYQLSFGVVACCGYCIFWLFTVNVNSPYLNAMKITMHGKFVSIDFQCVCCVYTCAIWGAFQSNANCLYMRLCMAVCICQC